MKYLVCCKFIPCCCLNYSKFYVPVLSSVVLAFMTVKYEACLEDGTLVSKSDGVEFTVGDG